jgi:uncharacterized protein YqeY
MNDDLINHLMGCKACYAAGGRYCVDGIELKLEGDSDFVVLLKTVDQRRQWMELFRKARPDLQERLQEKVIQKYLAMKQKEPIA